MNIEKKALLFSSVFFSFIYINSCATFKKNMTTSSKINIVKKTEPFLLTSSQNGHCLNIANAYSADGNWIVYDTRNFDSDIAKTGSIEMVHVKTGEIEVLYKTQNQSEFGPGVGAVSFSPVANKIIFIQGIRNANALKPYGFTRRTGVAIDVKKPFEPIYMDARDVEAPFTIGALRGGTHAHQWSRDGSMISFTYNDYVIEQAAKTNHEIKDLRTVGLMFPQKVEINNISNLENNNGEMFSVLITKVTEKPNNETDEINKAFDECWIGKDGYTDSNGIKHTKAIAFQGNVIDENGKEKTEIFVVNIPQKIDLENSNNLEGTSTTRPAVPNGIKQKRISHLKHGVTGPRHWLRSTPNGELILFLTKDDKQFINVFGISPNGGEATQISDHEANVQSGLSISPNGQFVAYIVQNCIVITDIYTHQSKNILGPFSDFDTPIGCIQWNPSGTQIAFNAYVKNNDKKYLQIFTLDL